MSISNNIENLTYKHDFSKEVPTKRDVATCTENFYAGIGQAPVFNIHIHVPPSNETNATTMYLPKILPIIHVHFDELAKKLKNSLLQQNEGLSEKYFENIVKQITPKLGNVLLHHENNSCDRHFNKSEMDIVNQKQTLREKNSSIEFEGCGTDETITMNKHSNADVSNDSERTQGIRGDGLPNGVVYNGHPIKLKKAVVILKDILKSNSYKSGKICNLLNHQGNESSSSLLNGVANFGPQIKTEPAISCCENPALDEKQCINDDNSHVNSFNSSSFSDSVNFGFSNKEKSIKREILDSMVEGCNFSAIIEKFREKYGKCSAVKLENFLSESQTMRNDKQKDGIVENDKDTINSKAELIQNGVQTQKETIWVDQSYNVDDKQQGELYNTDELNLKEEIMSSETENQLSQNSYEIDIKCDTEMSDVEMSNVVTPFDEVVQNEVDQMHGCKVNEGLIYPLHVYECISDENEITAQNKLSSGVGGLKTLEFDSSKHMSDIIIKSEFVLLETNDLILNDKGDQNFDLKLVKKEMVSPKKSISELEKYEKRNSRGVREDESSPKKIKQSLGTPKKSETKASKGEDYIPLDVPGPTEFSVVPLSNVQACKTHDAKNFKKDMLFGKRVNRFTNPDHLKMYKLKKQAARTRYE